MDQKITNATSLENSEYNYVLKNEDKIIDKIASKYNISRREAKEKYISFYKKEQRLHESNIKLDNSVGLLRFTTHEDIESRVAKQLEKSFAPHKVWRKLNAAQALFGAKPYTMSKGIKEGDIVEKFKNIDVDFSKYLKIREEVQNGEDVSDSYYDEVNKKFEAMSIDTSTPEFLSAIQSGAKLEKQNDVAAYRDYVNARYKTFIKGNNVKAEDKKYYDAMMKYVTGEQSTKKKSSIGGKEYSFKELVDYIKKSGGDYGIVGSNINTKASDVDIISQLEKEMLGIGTTNRDVDTKTSVLGALRSKKLRAESIEQVFKKSNSDEVVDDILTTYGSIGSATTTLNSIKKIADIGKEELKGILESKYKEYKKTHEDATEEGYISSLTKELNQYKEDLDKIGKSVITGYSETEEMTRTRMSTIVTAIEEKVEDIKKGKVDNDVPTYQPNPSSINFWNNSWLRK